MYIITHRKIARDFNRLNKLIFNDALPHFRYVYIFEYKKTEHWAWCCGDENDTNGRFCDLRIGAVVPSRQTFLNILAHEMIHLCQWLSIGEMHHGKPFFQWNKKLKKFNITVSLSELM